MMPRKWKRSPELLLLPNIPRPLHGVNPRSVLGSGWWNKERQAAYASTNHHCMACGVHKSKAKGSKKWVEGHEVYDTNYLKGRLTYLYTAPLCPFCHQFIHDGRLQWLLDDKHITRHRFVSIKRHGFDVLSRAGLHRPTYAEREIEIMRLIQASKLCRWADWRLVIEYNGSTHTYPPIHKSMEAWYIAMSASK